MGTSKQAAKKTTSQGVLEDDLDQIAASMAARQQFMSSALNMSWRLAVTVVVPIVAGVKLDEHFKSAPSLTLLGFMIAAVAGCVAVWGTIKELNKEQAEEDAAEAKAAAKKSKRSVKRA
jgi:F0F1-type ATP synthase assembly protein I